MFIRTKAAEANTPALVDERTECAVAVFGVHGEDLGDFSVAGALGGEGDGAGSKCHESGERSS